LLTIREAKENEEMSQTFSSKIFPIVLYNKNLADNADSGAGLVWFSMGKIFHLSDAENYFKLFFFLKNRVTDLPEIVQTKIDQLLELVTQGRGF
jgi:hypothetical protein